MPKLDRNFFSGYYGQPAESWKIFYGCEMFHATEHGRFIGNDGKEKVLTHILMCKDELPDTYGRNCEMCDFSLASADSNAMPSIILAILSGNADSINTALSNLAPSAKYLVSEDLANGSSAWEIAETRAGIIVPEFLGFTFDEVLSWTNIYQPTFDEEGNEISNIQRCSLEGL